MLAGPMRQSSKDSPAPVGRRQLGLTLRVAAALWAVSAIGCGTPGGQPDLAWSQDGGSVALLSGGLPVWQFQYDADLAKPMFHPVSLVDGTVLTWDAPPDHTWHHALWFSWKYLNGVNYWEERRSAREPEGVTEWSDVQVETRPDYSARISMDLAYHPPGQPPVLREHREVTVSAPAPDGSYHFDWVMVFTAEAAEVAIDRTPITGEPDGKPYGGYAGLSIRFAKDFTGWDAVTTDGPVERDTSVPFHAEKGPVALDFSGAVGGREAGVALFDHPSNLNAPTPWYIVMNTDQRFGFAEAAVIYYRPHSLRAGERLRLRYRVVVHEGRWDSGRLQSIEAQFVKETNDER